MFGLTAIARPEKVRHRERKREIDRERGDREERQSQRDKERGE